MAPDVAERDAVSVCRIGQIGPSVAQHAQHVAGAHALTAPARPSQSKIRRDGRASEHGGVLPARAEPAQQRGTAVERRPADCPASTWNAAAKRRIGQPRSAGGVDAQRPPRIGREQSGAEGVQARDRRAPRSAPAPRRSPARGSASGARRRRRAARSTDGEIDALPRALRDRRPCQRSRLRPAIDAAGLEMAPAAVIRNAPGRDSVCADHRDRERGHVGVKPRHDRRRSGSSASPVRHAASRASQRSRHRLGREQRSRSRDARSIVQRAALGLLQRRPHPARLPSVK